MANRSWRGDALGVAQVDTLTVGGTPANGQTYDAIINGKTVRYTATGVDTNNTIAAGLQALLENTTTPPPPEFREETWTVATNVVTGTSDEAGRPFTVTTAASGTGTLTRAAVTANSGPRNWDVAGNWTGAAIPITGDAVSLENSSVDILYGLGQGAVTLTSLNIPLSFTGKLGLPRTNPGADGAPYFEYRPTYLTIGATTVNIGQGEGQGAGRWKLDNSSIATTVNVSGTGSPEESGVEAFLWIGTNAANVMNVSRGSVGIAVFLGELATLATLRVGYLLSVASDATVRGGAGLTLTTLEQDGGTVELNNNVTTVHKSDGVLNFNAGTLGTLNLDGGAVYYNSAGTLTTANVREGGRLDFSRDQRTKIVTNCTVFPGGEIYDPNGVVTWTNGIVMAGGAQISGDGANVKINIGPNRTIGTIT